MNGRNGSGRGGVFGFVAALVVAACIALGVYGVDQGTLTIPRQPGAGSSQAAPDLPSQPVQVVAPPAPPPDMNAVAAGVVPSIVDVVADIGPLGTEGAGTGIIVSGDGEVLTSHHVIKGADTIAVTDVVSGLIYDATVLGYDSEHDIALLKLADASGLPAARIGDSSKIAIGEPVVAIGNAGGTGGAPTTVIGTATALDASIVAQNEADFSRKYLDGMIEVAADVTAGQSGGSLVDDTGAVIGVIAASSGAHGPDPQGTKGFAVPIDTAMGVVNQIHSGRSTDSVHVGPTATLGVMVSDNGARPGAHVDLALPRSAAQSVGLTEGDTIDTFDGRTVDSTRTLRGAISMHKPGDTVQIAWTDGAGARRTAAVQLLDGPPN